MSDQRPDGGIPPDRGTPDSGLCSRPEIDALVSWLEDRHGGPVTVVGDPETNDEGFDSTIVGFALAGQTLPSEWRRPLVLRIKADADRTAEAHREAEIQGWLADRGYSTPRVLAVFDPGRLGDLPAQVMERAPGTMMLDELRRRPWRALGLARRLAAAHAALHALPGDGFPADADLLDRRLQLTRRTATMLDDGPLQAGLARVEAISPELRAAPAAVCHGDFHPLNVLVDGRDLWVIDWTDAGLGDRHGDIARTVLLFEMAAVAASDRIERAVLGAVGPALGRAYLRGYRRHAPVDERRLALWKPVHLLHGWSQARALHAGLFDRGDVDDDRTERVPEALVGELERRFDEAMAVVAPG